MSITNLATSSPALPVLRALSEDPSVRSVWLIGSQANGNATAESDWDLLAFRTTEPCTTTARQQHVDVLWVGPSGAILLEGQGEEYTFKMNDLQWTETSDGVARYCGKRSVDFLEGQAFDSDTPRSHRPWLCAHRLWPAMQQVAVGGDA